MRPSFLLVSRTSSFACARLQATCRRARVALRGSDGIRAVSSVVERLVYTEDVGSSTLSPPTIQATFGIIPASIQAWLGSGAVRCAAGEDSTPASMGAATRCLGGKLSGHRRARGARASRRCPGLHYIQGVLPPFQIHDAAANGLRVKSTCGPKTGSFQRKSETIPISSLTQLTLAITRAAPQGRRRAPGRSAALSIPPLPQSL